MPSKNIRLATVPRDESRFVTSADIPVTLAALAGAAPSSPVDGTSFVGLLTGEARSWRTELFFDYFNFVGHLPGYAGVHGEQWKYSEYPSTGEQELYDLVNDPYELDNRAADPALASTLAALQSSLDQYLPPP